MKILVAESMSPAAIRKLQTHPGWQVILSSPAEFTAHVTDCDAIFLRSGVRITRELIALAPRLKIIGRAGAGVDNIDLDAATEAGVLVTNTPGGNAVAVAELTIAFLLALARPLLAATASTSAGAWEKHRFLGTELRGKTLGIIGLGAIGREVAKRAQAFDLRVIATDPYVEASLPLLSLDELLPQSDYVSLHCALTAETRRMIGAAQFAKMKPGVRFINCARGEIVDEAALLHALQSGQVAGAALDVFDPEPPAASNPLLRDPRVVATPHIGGSTIEAQELIGERIVDQVVQYLTTGAVTHAVNQPGRL